MPENQTAETGASVDSFLQGVANEKRRQDACALLELMRSATGAEPRMWGPAMVGFGKYHYRYESGREGDMFRVGFSPRKANLAIYLLAKDEGYQELLATLGKHKTGGSCLYINRMTDVDLPTLQEMVSHSWRLAEERYGPDANA